MDRSAGKRRPPKHLSIRAALTLAVCAAVLPPAAIIVFASVEHGAQVTDHAREQVERQALALAGVQMQLTASTRQMLRTLASLPSFRQGDRQRNAQILRTIHEINPEYVNLSAVDERGFVTASSLLSPGADLSRRPHVRRALSGRRFAAGDYFLNLVDAAPSFAYAAPLFDHEGNLIGALTAALRLDTFDHLFDYFGLPENAFLGFVDMNGTCLHFYPPKGSNPVGSRLKPSVWEKIRTADERDIFVDTGSDGIQRDFGFRGLSLEDGEEPYVYLVYAVPTHTLLAQSRAILIRNLILMAVSTALAVVFAVFLSQWLFGVRLALIIETTIRLREGDLTARVNLGNDGSDLAQIGVALDSMAEILERRDAEKEEVARSLAASLAQKDILLKEVHHRVKNNLQTVLSLVRLQEDDHGGIIEFRKNIESRITAMAVAHEMLYEAGDVGVVDLGRYSQRIVDLVSSTWKASVEVNLHADEIRCNLDTAIPFGLALNELTVNAFKHAFTVTGSGRLCVSIRRRDGEVALDVADDGPGLPSDFSIAASPGLGLRLTQALSLQLNGSLSWHTGCGQRFSLRFPAAGRLA